jgi:GGDEF domain-containing protein
MAATDPDTRARTGAQGVPEPLSPPELQRRLEEEIGRAERHRTDLSCLLVVVENIAELARSAEDVEGEQLSARALAYIASALGGELRRFDRIARPRDGELAIVLPGADGPRGEMVARRILDRVRSIKIELQGTRRPLALSVGLAAWRAQMTPQQLIERARAAAARQDGEDPIAADGRARGAEPGSEPGGTGEEAQSPSTTAFGRMPRS